MSTFKSNRTLRASVMSMLLLALAIAPFLASAQNSEPKLEINGFVRNYMGLLFESGDYSIIQNTLDLQFKHRRKHISLFANPFYYQYPGKSDYFRMRELYMDVYSDKLDLRIGKQQIVWGQADGVFITDVVSPLNLTEFLLWDFNEIRRGITAVKAKYYPHPDHQLEFVWIPAFTPAILPDNNSIWQPQQTFPAPVTFDYSLTEVPENINNSELFLRYSLSKSSVDLQVIGAYTWDDYPSMHVSKVVDSTMNLVGLNIAPQHHRLSLVGMNFSSSVGSFVLRGEAAFYDGKQFQTTDPMDADALVSKQYMNYVVGLDRSMGDWKVSSQFIQRVIFDYEVGMADDEVDNLVTVLVNKTMMNDQLRLEMFGYIGLNNQDAFVRVRGFYFPHDGLSVELGTNLFFGTEGTFGRLNHNSMVYSRIKYSF